MTSALPKNSYLSKKIFSPPPTTRQRVGTIRRGASRITTKSGKGRPCQNRPSPQSNTISHHGTTTRDLLITAESCIDSPNIRSRRIAFQEKQFYYPWMFLRQTLPYSLP